MTSGQKPVEWRVGNCILAVNMVTNSTQQYLESVSDRKKNCCYSGTSSTKTHMSCKTNEPTKVLIGHVI